MAKDTSPACLNCSQKHYRCDRAKPSCGNCTDSNKTCRYSQNSLWPRPSQSAKSKILKNSVNKQTNENSAPPAEPSIRIQIQHLADIASRALGPRPRFTNKGKRPGPAQQGQNSILRIGIDFGTTYCSVAFARDAGSVNVREVGKFRLQRFVSVRDGSETQVPCEMAWSPSHHRVIWGSEVDRQTEDNDVVESARIKYIKLGLDRTAQTEKIRGMLRNQLLELEDQGVQSATVEGLITKFLESLWRFAQAKIREKYLPEDPFRWKVETALAVPAIWKQEAVDKMLRAASDAGIPNPYLVSEPSCAAHYLLQREQEQIDDPLQDGTLALESWIDEAFCVADLGGGTVDLITYSIQSLKPLRMKEEVTGSGLCHLNLL
jgi:hypothetical protein